MNRESPWAWKKKYRSRRDRYPTKQFRKYVPHGSSWLSVGRTGNVILLFRLSYIFMLVRRVSKFLYCFYARSSLVVCARVSYSLLYSTPVVMHITVTRFLLPWNCTPLRLASFVLMTHLRAQGERPVLLGWELLQFPFSKFSSLRCSSGANVNLPHDR